MSVPQSLPSFAQAFSSSSLSEITHISNALPPIQSRPAHSPPRTDSKKRARQDNTLQPVDDAARQSPALVRIKEEDRECQSISPPAVQPLSKKRRVTVSAIPHPSPAELVPASPAHASFPTTDSQSDHRRETVSASAPGSVLSTSPPGDQLPTPKLSRIGRISPTTISVLNRCAGNAVASGSQATTTSSARPLTPPLMQPADPPAKPPQLAASHSLPPPPISFARRRAAQSGGRKKKPADILISPRGAGPSDPLAPVIQSAPPVPDPGRFPMAIPRLPFALNNTQPTRRVAGNVPPTPTRFSLQGTTAPPIASAARPMPSPPNPSVPISNALVPPTPHALHHPGYSGDKTAFLAPFEVFYDALNDSKQLKNWLSDQLQKSNTLMASLKQQQEQMNDIVEDLVEKRTRAMQDEMTLLRQRLESLEEALLAVRAERPDATTYGYPAKSHQNGAPDTSSYHFPAPDQRRTETVIRVTSPERERERQPSVSPPVDVSRRPSLSMSTRGELQFPLGTHNRSASGSAKSTPPVRPQSISERTSSGRPTDSRAGSRMWAYGNGSASSSETSRGDKT